jgi:phage shock protein A
MALLERVSTLLRANVSDLLTKAEDPEKLARQLVLDMENQLIQVKTQVAIAIADRHLLEKKKLAQEESHSQWLRKAEVAAAKGQDGLAREALERALSHQRMAEALAQQCEDQGAESDTLRSTYSRLQQKLAETQSQVDILAAQLRRNRAMQKVAAAQAEVQRGARPAGLAPLKSKVDETGSHGRAARTMVDIVSAESLEDRFTTTEKNDQVEALLLELKERRRELS